MSSKEEYQNQLEQAQAAEQAEDFFRASYFYKDALSLALKNGVSKDITLCKNKIVEMNKKSLTSGKDFKEVSVTKSLTEDEQQKHEKFISNFLNQDDLPTILDIMGKHPFFFPKVKDVQEMAQQTMPVSYQIASLTTISDEGHNLRGSADGDYAWFIKMYEISQGLIMQMYVGRIIYELMKNDDKKILFDSIQLSNYFSNSEIFEKENLDIILVGLEKYMEEDYVSALHVLVPQFEAVFLKLSEKMGIDIVALDQKRGVSTRTKVLSENYLDSEGFTKVWGEDLCRQIKFILFEQMGYKLRHKIAHGEIKKNECNFGNTTLILYLYLVLIARIEVKHENVT